MPLFAVSPERLNQRLPLAATTPSDLGDTPKGFRNHRATASDVQSKVTVFNNLTRESSSQKLASGEALKRALMGREEAEQELYSTRTQLNESRDRERRVGERLDSMFEELATFKERQAHEKQVYEKELRKAKKEAYKASSATVNFHEDLKTAKGELKSAKEELKTEKTARANAEQACFEMEYRLAGMTEEVGMLREKVRVMKETKESEEYTVANMAEEVGMLQEKLRIMEESKPTEELTPAGMTEEAQMLKEKVKELEQTKEADGDTLAAMAEELETLREKVKLMEEADKVVEKPKMTQEDMDAWWAEPSRLDQSNMRSPTLRTTRARKNRFARKSSVGTEFPKEWQYPRRDTFNPYAEDDDEPEDILDNEDEMDYESIITELKAELRRERRWKDKAEDMVHFLNMECQFKLCSCRIAESKGERYVYDYEYDNMLQAQKQANQDAEKSQHDTAATSGGQGVQQPFEPLVELPDKTAEDKENVDPEAIEDMPSILPGDPPQPFISLEPREESPTSHRHRKPLEPLEASRLDALHITLKSPSPQPPPGIPETSSLETPQAPPTPLADSPPQSPTFSPLPIRIPTSFATPSANSSRPLVQLTPHPVAPHTTAGPERTFFTPSRNTTNTTTMTVPLALAADDVFSPAAGATPISRAQALEQIRARRDRARSVVLNGVEMRRGVSGPGTPRTGGRSGERRDVSAPAGKC